ncbi:hypothetical protein KSF_025420 [Reticulibacter mediterranei]|uniref:Uncharacterized protein n=1 Tax=Reticulibacter mediterranei TaxID=2778369 RepID=A0A8J3IJC5_9CHLR|nr:hypothetical protein KSF_025420 [Reticulibacter mediterranei]
MVHETRKEITGEYSKAGAGSRRGIEEASVLRSSHQEEEKPLSSLSCRGDDIASTRFGILSYAFSSFL